VAENVAKMYFETNTFLIKAKLKPQFCLKDMNQEEIPVAE